MTEDEFRSRFLAAIDRAMALASVRVVERQVEIELHGAGHPSRGLSIDDAVRAMFDGPTSIPVVIDVGVRHAMPDRVVVFVGVSGRRRVGPAEVWDPGGIGPFKPVRGILPADSPLSG